MPGADLDASGELVRLSSELVQAVRKIF